MGTKNAVSTATQTPPSWVQSGYKELFRDADRLADRNYRPYTGGFTADQQAAFQNIANLNGSSQPYFTAANNNYGAASNAIGSAGNSFGSAGNYYNTGAGVIGQGVGSLGGASSAFGQSAGVLGQGLNTLGSSFGALNTAANTLGGSADAYRAAMTPAYQSVGAYMNPYVQNVVNATMANMQETNARQQQDVLGNAASRGALGGNRVGVAQAELARQQNLANQQTISGLYSDAYNSALSAAQQQQGFGMTGAGGLAGVGQAQLGLGSSYGDIASRYGDLASGFQGIGSGLTGVGSTYGGLGQGFGSIGQGFTGIGQGQIGQGQAYTGVGAGQTGLGQTAMDTNLAQTAAQLGAGTQQQQFDYQQYLNKLAFPYQKQSWLSGIYGGIGPNAGGQTVNQIPQGNILSQIIGGIVGGASLFNRGGVVHAAGGGVMPYANDNGAFSAAPLDLAPYASNDNTPFLSYIPEAGETGYTRASYPSIQDYEIDDPFAEGKSGAKATKGVGTWLKGFGSDDNDDYASGGVVRGLIYQGRPQSTNIEDRRRKKKRVNGKSLYDEEESEHYLFSDHDPGAKETFHKIEGRAGHAYGGVVGRYAPGGIVPDDQYSMWRNAHSVLPFLPNPPPLETAASTRAGAGYNGQMPATAFSSPTDRVVRTVEVDRFGNLAKPSPMLNSSANNLGVQGTKHPRGYEVPSYNSLNEPWPGEYDQTLTPGTYRRNGDIIQNNPVKLLGNGPIDAGDIVVDQSSLGLTSPGVQPKREPIEITVPYSEPYKPSFADRTWADVAPEKPMVWEDAKPSGVVPAGGDPWGGNMRMGAQKLDGFGQTPGLVTGTGSSFATMPTAAARIRTRASDATFAKNRAAADAALAIDMAGGSTQREKGTQSSYGMSDKQWSKFMKMTPGADRTAFINKVRAKNAAPQGKAFGGVVRPGYAPGGVIGDVPYTVGDQFVTEPTPGYSQNIGDAFESLRAGNGLNLAPDVRQALLAAGAGMMASRSPFALQGIGEGALKGVSAWNDRQALERENARARADIANQTKNANSQQQLVAAQVPLLQAQTNQARYIVQRTPVGVTVFDLQNPGEPPKVLPWGAKLPNGEIASPGNIDTAEGGFTPLFDTTAPNLPPGGFDPLLMSDETSGLVTQQTQNAFTDARTAQVSAASAQQQLAEMKHQIDQLPDEGFLTPGANFNGRLDTAKAANTMMAMLGMKPLTPQEQVAAGEDLAKLTTRIGFELSNTVGSEAARIVEDAVSAVPGGHNTKAGADVILNSLDAMNRRRIDYYNAMQSWASNHYGSISGFDEWFNSVNPPELYAISAYVPSTAIQALRANPDKASDFNQKFGHGRDVAQYVLAAMGG